MRVTVAEAAARLPELIAAAQAGEEVIIANDSGPEMKLALVAPAMAHPIGSAAAILAAVQGIKGSGRSAEEIDADIQALRDDWS